MIDQAPIFWKKFRMADSEQISVYQIFISAKTGAPSGIFDPKHNDKLISILDSPNYDGLTYVITDGNCSWNDISGGRGKINEQCKVITVFLRHPAQSHLIEGLAKQLCNNLGQGGVVVVKLGQASEYEC